MIMDLCKTLSFLTQRYEGKKYQGIFGPLKIFKIKYSGEGKIFEFYYCYRLEVEIADKIHHEVFTYFGVHIIFWHISHDWEIETEYYGIPIGETI